MKRTHKFTAILAVLAFVFAACEHPINPTPGGDEGNNDPKERVIVYTVGQTENRQTLDTEGEWDALLDVLCHFPGNEQTFRIAMESFRAHPEKQALFAGYLAKLGDDRALPELTEAAGKPDLPYLTFIELRNAIESLGGVCPEREYDDDPEYEALRDLDRT